MDKILDTSLILIAITSMHLSFSALVDVNDGRVQAAVSSIVNQKVIDKKIQSICIDYNYGHITEKQANKKLNKLLNNVSASAFCERG